MSHWNLHVAILAGGSGTRFWPLSREKTPKQLLNILGDRTMLAMTLERAAALVPARRIRIVTTREQAGEIRRELGSIGMPDIRVLEEPAGRNTAPAIGLAAVDIASEAPEDVLAVFPADHHIRDPQRFLELLEQGAEVAAEGHLVTLGIRPHRPETGYGYIQRGEPLDVGGSSGRGVEVFRVKRFKEKPDFATARKYVRSGDFFWNGGIFLWRADRFMEAMKAHLPDHYAGLMRIRSLDQDAAFAENFRKIYEALESISVDHGILERAENVAVIPADMGWSDVGSWQALMEILPSDARGNILRGDVEAVDTARSLVMAPERFVATLGVEDLVVVDTADALLVGSVDRSQEVREIAEILKRRGRPEASIHRQVLKPWGAYRVLDLQEGYQVKWLDVLPGQRMSLQSHRHRQEHWTVVSGTATVTLDARVLDVPAGGHVLIPKGCIHRLENRGSESIRVIEVQTGEYLGEDDIIRHEDDYGRLEGDG